ncbi:P-loop containing nucleoside triphosphate hydrolase protein [Daedalea quercina L-15889]|uniref:p-loop containing nucleoside triphosphate hydrolase protein n=1 Tax=Daedalea quercina L-15889 TaxID=1314783 RepID=A0A165NF89_9APHY|nr:P-loop containing nucleoside triphosphate hydrolase protein [Daedalea quercina L-15889]
MWYKYHYIRVSRKRVSEMTLGHQRETLELSILAFSHAIVNVILNEAKEMYNTAKADIVSVYTANTDSSAVGNGMQTEYGPPGSGKTFVIRAIAGELGLDVYVVTLSRPTLDDNTLYKLIADLPERCIALMEDIDVAFRHDLSQRLPETSTDPDSVDSIIDALARATASTTTTSTSSLSLSGLLNALDGIAAQEGRLLFATTNDYGALDPALCRPGRMDVHVEFHNASKFQAEELFRVFY